MPNIDYSHEVRIVKSKPLRLLLLTISSVSLALGIIGIFLPVLPTTPFILLAATCYAKCSPRFYNWLMNHPHLSPPLRRWKEQRVISKGHKTLALSLLWITLIPTILFAIPILAIKILLALIGLAVSAFLLSVKSNA